MSNLLTKKSIAIMLGIALFFGAFNSSLAQSPFNRVKSTVKTLSIEGESFVQRDLNYYVKEVASKTNPDYLHDDDEAQWAIYLNRPHPTRSTLRTYFSDAAKEFGVPVEILMAIGYVESNWTQMGPSMDIRWGVMRLGENNYCNTLADAANLLGVSKKELKDNARTNIRGAAALLAKYAGKEKKSFKSMNDWFEAVKEFSGHIDDNTREMAAEEYYKILKNGVKSFSLWNENYELKAYNEISIDDKLINKVKKEAEAQSILSKQKTSTKGTYDEWYSGADEIVTTPNQSIRSAPIDAWVNHWFGTGTWAGAISWLSQSASSASAHFCIRNDGYLVQMVGISKKAWHATIFNSRAIGIEHHATIDHPEYWESTSMLIKSAEVARYYCDAIGIPKVRKYEVYEPGIYGHTDVPTVTKNCPGPMPWDQWMDYLNGGTPPMAPVILAVENQSTGNIKLTWKANTESDLAGYKVYYSTADDLSNYTLLADENTISASATSYTTSTLSGNSTGYNFKLTAVNTDDLESGNGDIYASYMPSNVAGLEKILVVDGFDRQGSYSGSTHTFATTYMRTLRDAGGVYVSSCANEALTNNDVSLSDYDLVFWFTGDESTTDETFSDAEQALAKTYLEAGGKMIVSGSEIGWDLYEKGLTSDKDFFNNYLKATYVSDGGSGRTPASGIAGTDFDGISANFGVVYPEDYPDDVASNGGSENIMTYANGANCGVAYKGTFGTSTQEGGVVFVSFTLETVSYEPSIKAFFIRALDYLKDDVVIVPNVAPTAAFSSSLSTANKAQSISFDASASSDSDGTIASYSWNFGDGTTATGVTASHAYAEVGTYTVTLTVTDNDTDTGVTTSSIQVVNQAPTAEFAVNGLPAKANQTVTFDASASSDSDGTIMAYAWDFGDGTTASGVNASHAYAAVGNYTVSLTVTDNDAAINNTTTLVEIVSCIAPSVTDLIVDYGDFGYTQVGNWSASSYTTGYQGTNYYHDGGTAENGWSVTFAPNIETTGMYKVYTTHSTGSNRATNVPIDINDLSGKTTVTVNQQNDNQTWVLLGTFEFYEGTDNSVVIRNDEANGVVIADAIRFVFESCTETQPSTVCEIPTGTNSFCKNPSNSQYTTTAVYGASSYEWVLTPAEAGSVTGSTISADVNWADTYTGAAQLKVRAVYSDASVGDYSSALSIIVNADPIVDFTIPISTINVGESITYQNNSTTGASYFWTFESGTSATSTSFEPTVQYNTTGIFDVSLNVIDVNLCSASKTLANVVTVNTVTGIDDFEIDMGHFDRDLTYSGSTVGISTSSTKARVTTSAYTGAASLAITLIDNSSSTSNWAVRTLSALGRPEDNVSISADNKIQLWLATSTANASATISLWIDDSDGIEETEKLSIINDGAYHLYEWDLSTISYTQITGNGILTGTSVTIDAIMLRSPNGSSNWSMNIDDVQVVGTNGAKSSQIVLDLDYPVEKEAQINVYPTIVRNYLNIKISSEVSETLQYALFDFTGKLVQQNQLNDELNQIDFSNLKQGMYIIQVIGLQTKESFKIIKE